MDFICLHESSKCIHYVPEDWPLIEVFNPDVQFDKEVKHVVILYILQGQLDFSYWKVDNYTLGEGDMMLFTPGTRVRGTAQSSTKAILLRLQDRVTLCDKYSLSRIYSNLDFSGLSHTHLHSHDTIKKQMQLLADCIEDGLRCFRFMEIKIHELFHYLRAYYRHDELARFVSPLASRNAQFMYFIWDNYRNVRNVKEFADLANCSQATFKVKFKKMVGMSASEWMAEQKIKNVYRELNCRRKSLKQIAEEYHFSSVSHLGTFCRKNFGKSPGSFKMEKEAV